MTRLTSLDINKLTPYAVGFDSVFDNFFKYMDHQASSTGYPPYNIVKNGDKFQIEIALAGVKMEDLDIEVAENVMTISHNPEAVEDENYGEILHRGISRRKFGSWKSVCYSVFEKRSGVLRFESEQKFWLKDFLTK